MFTAFVAPVIRASYARRLVLDRSPHDSPLAGRDSRTALPSRSLYALGLGSRRERTAHGRADGRIPDGARGSLLCTRGGGPARQSTPSSAPRAVRDRPPSSRDPVAPSASRLSPAASARHHRAGAPCLVGEMTGTLLFSHGACPPRQRRCQVSPPVRHIGFSRSVTAQLPCSSSALCLRDLPRGAAKAPFSLTGSCLAA